MVKLIRKLSIEEDPDFCATSKQKKTFEVKVKRIKLEKTDSAIKSNASNFPKFFLNRLFDEKGPIVKNFCVGLTLLEDEFVKNALLGNLLWKEVFDQDEYQTRKQRAKIQIHSKYEADYLFDNDPKSENSLDLNNNGQTLNLNQSNHLDSFKEKSFDKIKQPLFNQIKQPLFNQIKQPLFNQIKQPSFDQIKEPSPDATNESLYKDNSLIIDTKYSTADLKKDLNLESLNNILNFFHNSYSGQLNEIQNCMPVKCLNCSYTTTSIPNLFMHSSYHRNYCNLCNSSFKSVYSYFRHLGFHLKVAQFTCSSKLEFRCNFCYALFRQENLLIDHFNINYTILEERIMFGERTIKFKCKICNLIDVSFRSFQKHFSNAHTQIKCPFCNEWFKSLEQLEQHTFNDHKPFIDNYYCEFCFQKFTFKKSYENHLKFKHCIEIFDEIKSCFLCDHIFSENDFDLAIEHLANHCNLFLYSCDTCEFRTNSKSEMILHSMKISFTDKYVFLANRIDLKLLWYELSKQIKFAHEDVVIKDELNEAIESIL